MREKKTATSPTEVQTSSSADASDSLRLQPETTTTAAATEAATEAASAAEAAMPKIPEHRAPTKSAICITKVGQERENYFSSSFIQKLTNIVTNEDGSSFYSSSSSEPNSNSGSIEHNNYLKRKKIKCIV